MRAALRPWITSGVVLTAAGLVIATPAAAPLLNPQQHSVELAATDYGVFPFPEVGWDELVANTTANWDGLMELYDNTTDLFSLPSTVYTEGLPRVFNDLVTQVQQLAAYNAAYQDAALAHAGELGPVPIGDLPPFPDLYANPVLNPVSLATLLLHGSLSSNYAQNAAMVGAVGVYQNMLPSINDIGSQLRDISSEFEDALTGGSLSTDAIQENLTTIGTDLTRIGQFLSLAPTTILNSYLNGYPVQSVAPDPLSGNVPSIGDAYTLNAPFTSAGNVALTPYFGLLTNPFADVTENTGFGSGTSDTFVGTVPLTTGTLAAWLQIQQTLSNELLAVTANIPGSGVTAPDTGELLILGPSSFDISVDLSEIPVIGDIIDEINGPVRDFLNDVLPELAGRINDGVDALNSVIAPAVNGVLDVYNKCLDNDVCEALVNGFSNLLTGEDAPTGVGPISSDLIPTIDLDDIPVIDEIEPVVGGSIPLPDVVGGPFPAYVLDLARHQMAIIASLAGVAAPVTGTVGSDGIGNFLAPDPIINLGTAFTDISEDIFGDSPLTLATILPLDWTNSLANTLFALFNAGFAAG